MKTNTSTPAPTTNNNSSSTIVRSELMSQSRRFLFQAVPASDVDTTGSAHAYAAARGSIVQDEAALITAALQSMLASMTAPAPAPATDDDTDTDSSEASTDASTDARTPIRARSSESLATIENGIRSACYSMACRLGALEGAVEAGEASEDQIEELRYYQMRRPAVYIFTATKNAPRRKTVKVGSVNLQIDIPTSEVWTPVECYYLQWTGGRLIIQIEAIPADPIHATE